MSLGGQTIVIVNYSNTGTDALASKLTASRTTVTGCLHRPLRPQAGTGAGPARAEQGPRPGVAVSTEWWQTHAPPVAAVLAAKPSDEIEWGGETFQIISGVKPMYDGKGAVSHVVIQSERQDIG
jgi:hypothetical protein